MNEAAAQAIASILGNSIVMVGAGPSLPAIVLARSMVRELAAAGFDVVSTSTSPSVKCLRCDSEMPESCGFHPDGEECNCCGTLCGKCLGESLNLIEGDANGSNT